jgi:hypothetical protein
MNWTPLVMMTLFAAGLILTGPGRFPRREIARREIAPPGRNDATVPTWLPASPSVPFPTWKRPLRRRDTALCDQTRSESGTVTVGLVSVTTLATFVRAPMGPCQASGWRAVDRQDCVKTVVAAAGGVHPGGVPHRRPTVRKGLGSPLAVGSPAEHW